MTATQLATWCRRLAGYTDTDNYPDAELLDDINLVKDDLASRISKIRPDYFQIYLYVTTTLGLSTARIYNLTTTQLNTMREVNVKVLGKMDKYKKATYVDESQLPFVFMASAEGEENMTKYYNNEDPCYTIKGNQLILLTGELKTTNPGISMVLYFNAFPINLTSLVGTTELSAKASVTPTTNDPSGIPREFHMLWARLVAMSYKDRNSIPLSEEDKIIYQKLEQKLDEFKEGGLEEMFTTSSPDDGSDNGFDY